MAQVIVAYQDDNNNQYGLSEEESLQHLFVDYATAAGHTPAAPFNATYANLAALQAVSGWSGATAAPAGLNPRKLTLGVQDGTGNALATAQVAVGTEAMFAALIPTGATPFPTTNQTLTGATSNILGYVGESRSSN